MWHQEKQTASGVIRNIRKLTYPPSQDKQITCVRYLSLLFHALKLEPEQDCGLQLGTFCGQGSAKVTFGVTSSFSCGRCADCQFSKVPRSYKVHHMWDWSHYIRHLISLPAFTLIS